MKSFISKAELSRLNGSAVVLTEAKQKGVATRLESNDRHHEETVSTETLPFLCFSFRENACVNRFARYGLC